MRWLLDTNVWIDAHAGRPDASRVFTQARAAQGAWIGFSAITRLEALGFSGLTVVDVQLECTLPLTPALSRRERENFFQRWRIFTV